MLLGGPALFPGLMVLMQPARAQVADWVIEKPGVTVDHQNMNMSSKIIVNNDGGLIIRNSTINFSPTVDSGGGILVQPGGSLEVYDSNLASPNKGPLPIFESQGTLKLVSTSVVGFYGHFTEGGGVLIRSGTGQIIGSVFNMNRRQGVTVFGGAVSIHRSTFKNNAEGVMCKGVTNLLIEDSTFYRNSQHGIVASSCAMTIRKSSFLENYMGLGLNSTTITMTGSTINNNTIGVDLSFVPSTTIDGNKIDYNTQVGIRSTSSNPLIKSNEMTGNALALNLTGGGPQVTGNNIFDNNNGIIAVGAGGQISGNTISGSNAYGIYIIGGTVKVLTNNYTPDNDKGRVAWVWKLSVLVNKETSKGWAPVNGSTVEVDDSRGGIVFYGTTSGSGQTRTFDVVEKYIDNGGNTVKNNPLKITASSGSKKVSKRFEISSNLTANVTLKATASSSLPIYAILAGVGVAMLGVAGGIYVHMKYGKEEEAREPRIKRGASHRRRGRKSLTPTATSRKNRVRKRRGRS
jgi:parallel beta-helix repeat protein